MIKRRRNSNRSSFKALVLPDACKLIDESDDEEFESSFVDPATQEDEVSSALALLNSPQSNPHDLPAYTLRMELLGSKYDGWVKKGQSITDDRASRKKESDNVSPSTDCEIITNLLKALDAPRMDKRSIAAKVRSMCSQKASVHVVAKNVILSIFEALRVDVSESPKLVSQVAKFLAVALNVRRKQSQQPRHRAIIMEAEHRNIILAVANMIDMTSRMISNRF